MPSNPEPDGAQTRREHFDRAIDGYDAKALQKCVDFADHRYVTVERDSYTEHRYVKGHRTLRAACDYLARVREEGEPFTPDLVLDLNSGERHELDVFAFVAPKSLDAIAVMMSRQLAEDTVGYLELADPDAFGQVLAIFRKAIDRR